MTTWLHIGSSQSVIDTLPRARAAFDVDTVITCNAGIEIEKQPDVYVAIDQVAAPRYEKRALRAQSRGTRLVTLRRDPRALCDRGLGQYDEFVTIGGQQQFDGKQYGEFQFTGLFTIQYAIIHGATTLILTGCDGYTGADDYFHDRAETKTAAARRIHTHEILAPAMRQIANASPWVRFIQYGNPVYHVESSNWEVRR